MKPQPEEPKNMTQFLGRTTEIHKLVKLTQLMRFHFWRVLCGNKHEPKSGILLCFCQSTSTNYRHATAANVCLFHPVSEMGKWMHVNPECRFIRRRRHVRRIRVAPYTWTIPRPAESWFKIHYLSPLLFLRPFVALLFFSFSAKPSADLELVGLSLSHTTVATLWDRLSKIPLGPVWSNIGPANVGSKWRKLGSGMIPAHNKKENVHPCWKLAGWI